MIHESWHAHIAQFDSKLNLDAMYSSSDVIFPPQECVFRAFELPAEEVRVVLVGQDPYHKRGQAHGLSFSVERGVVAPPSVRNMFKEICIEFPEREYTFGRNGDLTPWFYREKIMLLNAALTVKEGKAGSMGTFWKKTGFIRKTLEYIDQRNNKCVFLLLGNFAKSLSEFIPNAVERGRVVEGVHPSPLSAHAGFFESNIFREVERRLGEEIDWSV